MFLNKLLCDIFKIIFENNMPIMRVELISSHYKCDILPLNYTGNYNSSVFKSHFKLSDYIHISNNIRCLQNYRYITFTTLLK